MTYTPNTPWVDGSGGGTPLSAARLNNMEAGISPTYIAYTPTWTSTGSAPAIGNAVVTARYVQIGKLVHAYGEITFGSSSTFGTGDFMFALPVSRISGSAAARAKGIVSGYDNSASAALLARADMTSSVSTFIIVYGATYLGTATNVGATAPWTWATSDVISWDLVYEAA